MFQRPALRRAAPWLLLAATSTLVGLFFTTQAYANPEVRRMLSFRRALWINLTYYWFWGAAVPLVVVLAKRWRFEGGRWKRALGLHVLANVLLSAAIVVLTEAVLTYLLDVRERSLPSNIVYAFEANFHSMLPTYWLILAGFYAVDYYVKFRDREVRASQLEARLAEAQLRALRMQLQPHFLFNTLNSISSLMYSDLEAADSMMTRLADFLRLTLESDGAQEVTLGRELEFVERYLEIERIRFEDRLVVELAVEEAARAGLVPSLVLQPLVENALRHGIHRRPQGGRIALFAVRDGARLRIAIENDGPAGGAAEAGERQRVGLANTRERLAQLYGEAYTLRFEERPEGGAIVTLELPWRTADAAQDADRRRRAVGAAEAAHAAATP
ncbi:MAG TPA: histidine kinase [Thermoanaerobaculia bacterium]|nr:histidine kinase [Thermoanaerobaculia bacterium]